MKLVLLPRKSPLYLHRDGFTTAVVAGSVNSSAAVPGPGARIVVDAENKLSISGGKLVCAGGKASPAWGDPGLFVGPYSRRPGQIFIAEITPSATSQKQILGVTGSASGQPNRSAIYLNSDALIYALDATTLSPGFESYSGATSYQVAIVLRAAGAFYLIKGGGFTDWNLLWVSSADNAATIYGSIATYSGVWTSEYLNVITRQRWLPIPVVSDGFSITNQTDGLGHAEYNGGGGLAWVDSVGTWQSNAGGSGVANAAALAGGYAVRTVDCGTVSHIFDIYATRSGDNYGGIVRWVDSNNYVYFFHDGTTTYLRKVIGGVNTLVTSGAKTYVAGAQFRLISNGSYFRLFYNNSLVGTASVIADSVLQSSTKIGLYSTNVLNTFNNAVAWPRTTYVPV
jgi:hypothetical protein